MQRNFYNFLAVTLLVFSVVSCSKDDSTILHNDCIKRSIGPNLVGGELEFAYAMSLPKVEGRILSASVEASIQGTADTWMEHRSYYTGQGGVDTGVTIGEPSTNSGARTDVTFTVDTCAATLRYYYNIPEEARGREVSFTFTANASNGETVTYTMGPYTISRMDMKLDMAVSNSNLCYLSLEDMTVYDAEGAAANPGKIDLVYLYRSIAGITFAHALVSPGTNPEYLPGVELPPGVNKTTRIRKAWNLTDRQLARRQEGIYVDDLDFIRLDLNGMPDYALNLVAQAGIWAESQDKRYKAYIYINSVNAAGTAVVSMKRYVMN